MSVGVFYSVDRNLSALNFIIVIFGYQIGNILCHLANFKAFVFPDINCRCICFAIFKNTVAVIIAATICRKEHKTVHLFFKFIGVKVFGKYLSVSLYVADNSFCRKQKPAVAICFPQ